VSFTVQAFPSLQLDPFAAGVVAEQTPVDWLHVPATWHIPAVQTTGFAPTQVPFWQLSLWVQALLSEQVDPFEAWTQLPVVGAQTLQVPHAAPAFCQAPFVSHDCGWLPLQVFEPGEQTPVHTPLAVLQT
jgi:hypothetical protein